MPGKLKFARAVGFGVATALLLGLSSQWAPLHPDTARDLLLARQCQVEPSCASSGATTSYGGFVQGASWVRLLEARERAGLGLANLERLLDLLLALAAAALALTAGALGLRAGFLTWAVWVPATLATTDWPVLWNLSPAPLVLALFWWALLDGVRGGRFRSFAAGALALGFAVELHLAFALLVPVLVICAIAAAARPLWAGLAALVAVAVPLGVHWLVSGEAFAANRAALEGHGATVLVGLGATAIFGVALRQRARALEDTRRAWWAAVAGAAAVPLALFLLSGLTGHHLETYYLAPMVAPFALAGGATLGGAAARLAKRRAPVVEALAAALIVWAAFPAARAGPGRALSLREAEAVAVRLFARGVSFDGLWHHLRGPQAFELLGVLGALEPPGRASAAPLEDDLLVLRARRGELPSPPPGEVVELGGDAVALLVATRPFVGHDPLEVCRGARCRTVRFAPSPPGAPPLAWASRAYPGIPGLLDPGAAASAWGGEKVVFRLPLEVPAGAAPHRLVLLPHEIAWTIERVEGVAIEGPLPATAVTVRGGPAAGTIELSGLVPPDRGWAFRGWLPPLVELSGPAVALEGLLDER